MKTSTPAARDEYARGVDHAPPPPTIQPHEANEADRAGHVGRHTDLLLDETLRAWRAPISRAPYEDQIDPESARFRRELGLPTDRAVVMTGHQASFWHAGILAKYLAVDAVAGLETDGGRPTAAAWCVPDHVAETPGLLAYPEALDDSADNADAQGRWQRTEIDLLDAGGRSIATGAPEAIGERIEAVRAALASAVSDTDPAGQQIRAHADLLGARLGLRASAPVVRASTLYETSAFGGLVARMKADPDACVRAYNAAVARHPDAGVRPLALDEGELPLWRIDKAGVPVAAFVDDLDDAPPERIRPRALLFTGLLRARACDLFIHGTGGGVYDRVTEDWLRDWLGWELAPAGVATATLTLDLGVPDVSSADLRRATWRAHHARHNPGFISGFIVAESAGDLEALQAQKRALVERIESTPRGERDGLYFEMHAMLERARADHAAGLAALDARVRTIRAALADRAVARDRTWPWVLHSDADLRALHDDIRGRLGAGR